MKEWFEGKTVALIGNSMSLFDKEYGKEIDSHDVVVRLNKAAMLINRHDAKKSHGLRTDYWLFWNVSEYRKEFGNIDAGIKKMHVGHQGRNTSKISEVDFVYPDELYAELKKVAGPRKNPTTGFISIDYILHCNAKSLSVYGFDWKATPTHTDPKRVKEKKCPHNYDVEEAYCRDKIFSRPKVRLRK